MNHLPPLISDLAVILAVAGVVTLVFRKIGQPVVLGYLLAGVLVGPEVTFFPTVQSRGDIRVWAEIGIIVLLFALGLEFSFRKLAAIGRGAAITALTEIPTMFGLGFIVGQAFSWSLMDSLFLGGMVSISSTTIVIRTFDELGFRQRGFVNLVVGVLVVEDLVAVLLLVLLSTIAVSKSFSGFELLSEAARLGFFLILWFIAGIFLVPWFLRLSRSLMNEETTLIVALGLCLMMVLVATELGFSPALGAFIMGSLFAETPDGERIERYLKPVKDLFAAIFFVSIGMLIETKTLVEYWPAILVLSLVVVFGKFSAVCLGAILAGQRPRHAVQSGMSLAQIGEFSFIIASLGLSLKVTSGFLYPVAVAVSVVTAFFTPYLIRSADRVYARVKQALPQEWEERCERALAAKAQTPPAAPRKGLRLIVNSVIVVAIARGASQWLMPMIDSKLGSSDIANYGSLMTAVLMALPFLWAISAPPQGWKPGLLPTQDEVKEFTTLAALSWIGRIFLSLALLGFIVSEFTLAVASWAAFGLVALVVGALGLKNFTKLYDWLEKRFISHLNEKERERLKTAKLKPELAPWDAHLAEIKVDPDSTVVGRSLEELGLREKLGVTVALIERGSKKIAAPRRDERLMAHDGLYVIGDDEQLGGLTKLLGPCEGECQPGTAWDYGLRNLVLDEGSSFIGKTIRESGLREATNGLIVGIEREGKRYLNPDSLMTLSLGDHLWVVGDVKRLEALSRPS